MTQQEVHELFKTHGVPDEVTALLQQRLSSSDLEKFLTPRAKQEFESLLGDVLYKNLGQDHHPGMVREKVLTALQQAGKIIESASAFHAADAAKSSDS
eukprot:1550219-Amphidinium_carterae.1